MSATKKGLFGFAALLTLLLVAAVAMRPSALTRAPREVRLVARDMAFYLDGQGQPNPTLRFRAGETIRLVLKNEDRGMDHDFTVPDWAVRTRLIEDVGEDVVTFTVPDGRRAPATYACTPHSKMMRGTVEVD